MSQKQQPKQEGSKIKIAIETTDLSKAGTDLFQQSGILQSKVANDNSIRYHADQSNGVMVNNGPEGVVVEVLPSLGGTAGTVRTQLAFKDQLVAVVGSAYSSINCSESDLIKLAMYCQGLGALVTEVDVALAILETCSPLNAMFTKRLAYLKGWSFDDLLEHKKEIKDYRNRLAKVINTKYYLGKNTATDRLYYLLGNVFIDDNSQKGQPIVFSCPLYTSINSNTGNVHAEKFINSTSYGTVRLSYAYLKSVTMAAEAFALSLWYNDVAPYLFHIYGDKRENLYHFNMLENYPSLTVKCNPIILEVIRNCNILGVIPDLLTDTSELDIYEDSAGMIHQGGWNNGTIFVPGMISKVPVRYTYSGNNSRVVEPKSLTINLEEFPANQNEIAAIMELSHIKTDLPNSVTGITDPDSYQMIEHTGSIAIMGIYSFKWISESPYFERMHTWVANENQIQYCVVNSDTLSASTLQLVNLLNERQVSIAPNVKYSANTLPSGATLTTFTATSFFVKDRDNLITIPHSALSDYLLQQEYDMWHFSAPSYSGGKFGSKAGSNGK